MPEYKGSCHCGAISFRYSGPEIESGVRCNCSICRKKGAVMTPYTVAQDDIEINITEGQLATYQFSTHVAKHHFCNRCGIYTFHETLRTPGSYRINIGCLDNVDPLNLTVEVFDGASL